MKKAIPVLLAVAMLAASVLSVSADAILYGDLTNDGKVNNRDLALMQQYLSDWDVTVDQSVADVTADGKVNNRDLALLQQYLSDWEVQLGPDEPVVPPVELPSAGYDLDGRGYIFVDAISQNGYEVSVTFANHTDKWQTEETSYVEYICTDAEGNVLTLDNKYYGLLSFGVLEPGESLTMTLTLPEGTTKLEFGASRIIIWSQYM